MGASLQGLDKFKFDVSGSNIKSIQRGTASIASGLSITIPINAIDPTKSIVFLRKKNTAGRVGADGIVASLINSTTLQISRGYDYLNCDFMWEVIEFNNVKSKQTGSQAISGISTFNITPATFDSTKSIAVVDIFSTNGAASQLIEISYYIKNNTTIECFNLQSYATSCQWQLLTFN